MEHRENALERLREVHRSKPDDENAALELAQYYCDRGWFNEALELFSEIVNDSTENIVILLEYGNTLFKKGDYKNARNIFHKITELHPDRINGWNNLGIVQIKMEDNAAAHESFRHVLAIEPQNTGALLNIGNCFFNDGSYDEARNYFEKACSLHPDLSEGWYNLGNTLVALERFHDARAAYEKALRYYRAFPSALKNLGWINEREGRLEEAEQCYCDALEISKTDATLYVNMGNVHVRQKRYDDAKKCYLKAIRLAPHELHGWMGLRGYALYKGDISTFVRSTMAVLGRLSDEVLAQSIEVLYELHQIDKADDMLAQADRLGRKGDLLDVQRLLLCQRQKKEVHKIQALLRRLRLLTKPQDAVCRGLARYYLNEHLYNDAISWIDRIEELDATSLGIRWRAMLAQGKVKEVRKQILQYSTGHEDCYDTYFLLADIEGRRGNCRRAEILLVYALDHGFNNMEEIHGNKVLHELFESMTGKKQFEEVVS